MTAGADPAGLVRQQSPTAFRIGLGAVLLVSQLLVPFLVFMHRRVGGRQRRSDPAATGADGHRTAPHDGLLTITVCLTRWTTPPESVPSAPGMDAPGARTRGNRGNAVPELRDRHGVVADRCPLGDAAAHRGFRRTLAEHARLVAALAEPFHIVNMYETFARPEHRPGSSLKAAWTERPETVRLPREDGDTQKPPLWIQPGLSRLDTRMRLAA